MQLKRGVMQTVETICFNSPHSLKRTRREEQENNHRPLKDTDTTSVVIYTTLVIRKIDIQETTT